MRKMNWRPHKTSLHLTATIHLLISFPRKHSLQSNCFPLTINPAHESLVINFPKNYLVERLKLELKPQPLSPVAAPRSQEPSVDKEVFGVTMGMLLLILMLCPLMMFRLYLIQVPIKRRDISSIRRCPLLLKLLKMRCHGDKRGHQLPVGVLVSIHIQTPLTAKRHLCSPLHRLFDRPPLRTIFSACSRRLQRIRVHDPVPIAVCAVLMILFQ
mmetsp:Transcript_9756/g.16192  ORF Transcript_9756/g.16192 Transcript_9756/m.16192 type:complete len:213 (+) Transcript_9756:1340-1978(+)